MPGISTNAAQLLRRMQARQQAVKRELTTEARVIAREVSSEARRIMNREIYSVPIPFKAGASAKTRERLANVALRGKHGRWKRTGALLRAEKGITQGPVVVLINTMRYAIPRHMLGMAGGRRRIRSQGVRSVQWQSQAVLRKREYILTRRRQGVFRALARR